MILKNPFNFKVRHEHIHYQALLFSLLHTSSHHLKLNRVQKEQSGGSKERAEYIILNHLYVLQLFVAGLLKILNLKWVHLVVEVIIFQGVVFLGHHFDGS